MSLSELLANVKNSVDNLNVLQTTADAAILARDAARSGVVKLLDDSIKSLQDIKASIEHPEPVKAAPATDPNAAPAAGEQVPPS